MRRMKPALLGSLLLGLAAAAWGATPAVPAAPAVATVSTPAPTADALPADLFAPAPQATAGFTCTSPPTTVCNSCLYFGTPSAYQCTTFCLNGVLHRSCNTCGQGCNQ